MGLGGITYSNGTGAGIEGMKIAFHACRIDEEVSITSSYGNQSI